MGSAHFLVFALPILVAMRTVEDQVSTTEACFSVLRDNLVGLEIDLRCTQLGAFSLALAVWKLGGTQKLPQLSVACSGLKPNAKSDDWARLANRDDKARRGIEKLYEVFAQAPILGSLINPRRMSGSLMAASFDELQPLLEKALAREQADENLHELAVTAQGVARAAQLLASQFTLVATNVPYLGREGHNDALVAFSDRNHPDAAADLSTLMLDRCFEFVSEEGSVAVVMPQNWWVGESYFAFRKRVLSTTTWQLAAVLGEEAWQTFGDRGPNTTLTIADTVPATTGHGFFAVDVSTKPGMPVVGVETKARALGGSSDTDELRKLSTLLAIDQGQLMFAREARITVARLGSAAALSQYVIAGEGCSTGDNARFLRGFWEVLPSQDWLCYCGPGFPGWEYCNTSLVVLWESGNGELAKSDQARIQNTGLWRVPGVLVGRVRGITATLFSGGCFSKGAVLVSPRDLDNQAAVFAFLRSKGYEELVRTIDPRVSAATSVLTDVPFDLTSWQKEAAKEFPNGLPKLNSNNPTQSSFAGYPEASDHSLHVAALRLVGYRWPAQSVGTRPGGAGAVRDDIQPFADEDGIVCLSPMRGEDSAGQRLGALLAASYGADWTAQRLSELLAEVGYGGKTLEDWLRNSLFEQHCALFNNRPFLWHVWDGLDDGFSALLNYQKLTKTILEKLTYAYLGDWIQRQEAAVRAEDAGSEGRLVAVKKLQSELRKILDGGPPYDIFVRWKPVAHQPIGWEPDLNDGVRMNIRPFLAAVDVGRKGAGILRARPNIKWAKDLGKEPSRSRDEFPWVWGWDGKTNGNRWNDLHYSREFKTAARRQKGLA